MNATIKKRPLDNGGADIKELFRYVTEKLWPENLKAYSPSFEEAILADRCYREMLEAAAGKPSLLVLGESPGRTPNNVVGKQLAPEHKGSIPDHFGHVSLTHCLSYGEIWLIEEGEAVHYKNSGTPAIWKVLSCLAGVHDETDLRNFDTAFQMPKERKQRIESKNHIWNLLIKQRIVLMDISPISLQLDCGTMLVKNQKTGSLYNTQAVSWRQKDLRAILQYTWNHYVVPLLKRYQPESMLVLGKRVFELNGCRSYSNFCRDEKVHFYGYLPNPTARQFMGRNYLPHYRSFINIAKFRLLLSAEQEQQRNDSNKKAKLVEAS